MSLNTVKEPPKRFADIFKEELSHVRDRRRQAALSKSDIPESDVKLGENLVGIALSGGGIRSATFCLGLLQGMHEKGLLRIFDYVSTVSGGGFLGGWWSAWLARRRSGFRMYDINNASLLANQLLKRGDKVSEYIYDHSSIRTKELLKKLDPKSVTPSQELINALADDLNRMLDDRELLGLLQKGLEEEIKLDPSLSEVNFNVGLKKLPLDDITWRNRLLLERKYPEGIGRRIFPQKEMIDPEREVAINAPEKQSDRVCKAFSNSGGSQETRSAGIDPIHHLRMFANYLTPRRGLLSNDTWRIIAFVTRNLTMTWLILLPVLVALVLFGQLWFVGWRDASNLFIKPEPGPKILQSEEAYFQLIKSDIRKKENEMRKENGRYDEAMWKIKEVKIDREVQPLADRKNSLKKKSEEIVNAYFGKDNTDADNPAYTAAAAEIATVNKGLDAIEAGSTNEFQKKKEFLNKEAEELQKGILQKDNATADNVVNAEAANIAAIYVAAAAKIEEMKDRPQEERPTEEQQLKEQRLKEQELEETKRPLVDRIRSLHEEFLATQSVYLTEKQKIKAGLEERARETAIRLRLYRLAKILAPIVGWMILLGITYMLLTIETEDRSDSITIGLSLVVAAGVIVCLLSSKITTLKQLLGILDEWWLPLTIWALFAPAWLWYGLRTSNYVPPQESDLKGDPKNGQESEFKRKRRNLRRNQATLVQARLLVLLVVMGIVLLVSGFGHEIFNEKSFHRESLYPNGLVAAIIGSIAASIFTIYKVKPKGGSEKRETHELSAISRMIFAITPALVIVVLAIGISWVAHKLLQTLGDQAGIPYLVIFISFQVFICLLYAIHETKEWPSPRPSYNSIAFSFLGAGAICAAVHMLISRFPAKQIRYEFFWMEYIIFFAGTFIISRLVMTESNRQKEKRGRAVEWVKWADKNKLYSGSRLIFGAAAFSALMVAATGFLIDDHFNSSFFNLPPGEFTCWIMRGATAAIVLCFILMMHEMIYAKGKNRRSVWLPSCAYFALVVLIVFNMIERSQLGEMLKYAHVAIDLIAASLTWVVGFGWMVDPNAFSMHAFYRARLVRAYMGASNAIRGVLGKEITEPAAEDDVLLQDLKNCDSGAPFHLVNTTLNLAAARDLATAQRSAESFVLSQLYCGSMRTGYRNTSEYINGRLTLGAAASPNMGARTPSAALAMLMTVLNVRLGYWAPTPSKDNWRSPRARLWPFYLLREFLSRTNDLSDYCYLTDGGHFDNTGLYSLVQRGCRFIVIADCGADPKPCFGDLGDVIRRCRIDFGAEINLDISGFIKKGEDDERKDAELPFVVGTIDYSRKHLRIINKQLGESEQEAREGIIILFKPSITADALADVRQYKLENNKFPQQSTTNQWFDEAQFESYRRLGQFCANSAFKELTRIDTWKKLPSNYAAAVFAAAQKKYKSAGKKQDDKKESPQSAKRSKGTRQSRSPVVPVGGNTNGNSRANGDSHANSERKHDDESKQVDSPSILGAGIKPKK